MNDSKMIRIPMTFFGQEAGASGASGSSGTATGSENAQNGSVSGGNANPTNNTQQGQKDATGQHSGSQNPSLEQLIQSAVDRATNKIGNENKQLRAQLDELVKQKLTDEERIELERKQEREKFEAEKAQFIQEKNKLFAIKELAGAELNVESDKLEPLVSLVMGADENAIKANVKSLSDLVKGLVAAKVEATFKENGRNPAGSGNADKKDEDKKTEVADMLGKARAEKEKRSREILDKFTRRN